MNVSDCLWRPIDTIGCHLIGSSFIGGRSIEEVLATGAEFKKRGYKVTYNLLGEHVGDKERVDLALTSTLELIRAMGDTNRGNVSIKPTLYGLEISPQLFYERAGEIIECGKEMGGETEFDAERFRLIPATFAVFHAFASQFHYKGFIRQAVQAHLVRTSSLMDKYELWNKNLRIVQGSGVYLESPSVVLKNREEILGKYYAIARRNHQEGQVPFVATMRNRRLVRDIKKIFSSPHMFEFQMLYGPLGRELGEELVQSGWQVRMYIPFVVDWCKNEWRPYGMRRAATIRRLFFEDKEVRRAILREIKNRLLGATKKREKEEI